MSAWMYALDAYFPLINANMSFIGSSLLIYSILVPGRATKLKMPHFRILLGMRSVISYFLDLVFTLQ
jgi:hypothetical protein